MILIKEIYGAHRNLSGKNTSSTGNRTSVGATNQCIRSSGKFLEQILEWKPFEHFSARYQLKPFPVIITNHLHPVNGGTKLTSQLSFDSNLPRKFFKPLYKFISRKKIKVEEQMQHMRSLIIK